jgi:hypothetical protein
MCWTGEPGEPGVNGMNYPEMARKERKEKLERLNMSETDRQIELLKKLAEMEKKVINKDEAISFLQRAGILDENGDISDNYPNWKKYNEQ